MPSLIDENTQFTDSAGKPIVNGYIRIGQQNKDPSLNLIPIFADRAQTTFLPNPQRTNAYGRAVNKIWVPGKYSIRVDDSSNVQKYQELDNGEAAQTGTSTLINVQGIDTITAEGAPAITTLVSNQVYVFNAANANAGHVFLKIDQTEAKPVKKYGNKYLLAGDIRENQSVAVIYNATDDVFELMTSPSSGEFGGLSIAKKGADIASAPNMILLSDGNYNDITGTASIDGFTAGIGNETRKFHCDAACVLKHQAAPSAGFAPLSIPGEADFIASIGDEFEFTFDDAAWRCTGYVLASGKAMVNPPTGIITLPEKDLSGLSSVLFDNLPAGIKRFTLHFKGLRSATSNSYPICRIGNSSGLKSDFYQSSVTKILNTPIFLAGDKGFYAMVGELGNFSVMRHQGQYQVSVNAGSYECVSRAARVQSQTNNWKADEPQVGYGGADLAGTLTMVGLSISSGTFAYGLAYLTYEF